MLSAMFIERTRFCCVCSHFRSFGTCPTYRGQMCHTRLHYNFGLYFIMSQCWTSEQMQTQKTPSSSEQTMFSHKYRITMNAVWHHEYSRISFQKLLQNVFKHMAGQKSVHGDFVGRNHFRHSLISAFLIRKKKKKHFSRRNVINIDSLSTQNVKCSFHRKYDDFRLFARAHYKCNQ